MTIKVLSTSTQKELPQWRSLAQIAPILSQQEGVVALWLGGSLARGDADAYSDVDVRLAVTPEAFEVWRRRDMASLWGSPCLAQQMIPFGDRAILHHLVLASGEIYDIWIQRVEDPVHDTHVQVITCYDPVFAERLNGVTEAPEPPYPPVVGDTIGQAVMDYWLNSHKHRKVLHRGLDLVAVTGVQMERAALLRLWYVQATGRDCGPTGRQTIHGLTRLTNVVSEAQGHKALEMLGADLSSRSAICRAIERLRDEVTGVGRALLDSLAFDYPEALEQTVRREWSVFLSEHPEALR